ncbi:MAG: hypothetical protein H0W08_24350, partial [Acidobacteria bacterium]|nr:hypothetical protein [Acidobacteriota bacterium]
MPPNIEGVAAGLQGASLPDADVAAFVAPAPPPAVPSTSDATSGLPAAGLSARAAALPSPPPVESEEPRVRDVLARFESAYSSLNASAAQAIWPAVDQRSLSRAFDSLASQRVSLGRCSVSLDGVAASADCSGT